MANDFQTGGTCSGNWWSTPRTSGFDGLAMPASVSSSSPITDIGIGSSGTVFSWVSSELVEGKDMSSDEPAGSGSGSGSSITYQDTHKVQLTDQMAAGGSLIDSTLQMASFGLASPTIDWNQTLLRSSGRAEPSCFHATLQESNQACASTQDFSSNHLQGFQLSFGDEPTAFPLVPATYSCASTLLQGPLEPDNKLQQSLYENGSNYQSPVAYHRTLNELSQPLWTRFPQIFKCSPPQKQPTANPLHFSNSAPFWNASSGSTTELRSSFYPDMVPAQFSSQPLEQKAASSNLTAKSNPQGSKKISSEHAFKKPRMDTISPLPTFKVRKEKLGDRITALQQIVSPFGKTDTASVLHEAIEYIKFLHEQVGVLSTPYLKNGHPMQHQQNPDAWKDGDGSKKDLRSRGLCLVPIASTFPVASETTADFWTPTYGGSYR